MGRVKSQHIMRIVFILTLVFTLSCCQRLAPPRNPPLDPPAGQRCRGRNYDGRRCCTPENPCGYGEGDCDGPGDGGANDGHQGCRGDLVCGSNNCKKFGLNFHEKDDCCDLPETLLTTTRAPEIKPGVPIAPPAGQRCRGRNYDGRRCYSRESLGKERETVTDQVMVVLMTDTEVVVETLCVAVTIVSSLVLTTMRKTTVVSVQQGPL